MKIQESAENYLESILMLAKEKGNVRSIDIANHLGFSKPSVSVAMKNLRSEGYVSVDDDGYISLLPKGRDVAERTYSRHTFFTRWLKSLGVNEKTAAEDACRLEHVISQETFEAMRKSIKLPD